MDFPQYRKRFDDKSFYKVTSFTTFEEIQLVGKRFFMHSVHAKKYFEKLYIQDMLASEIPRLPAGREMFQMSTEEEFETIFKESDL